MQTILKGKWSDPGRYLHAKRTLQERLYVQRTFIVRRTYVQITSNCESDIFYATLTPETR